MSIETKTKKFSESGSAAFWSGFGMIAAIVDSVKFRYQPAFSDPVDPEKYTVASEFVLADKFDSVDASELGRKIGLELISGAAAKVSSNDRLRMWESPRFEVVQAPKSDGFHFIGSILIDAEPTEGVEKQ